MSEQVSLQAPVFEIGPRFTYLRSDAGEAVRLTLVGEIDCASVDRFSEALTDCQAHYAMVIADLRRLTFMDCGGLGVLLRASRAARGAGSRLVVASGPPVFERLIDATGVRDELDLVAMDG